MGTVYRYSIYRVNNYQPQLVFSCRISEPSTTYHQLKRLGFLPTPGKPTGLRRYSCTSLWWPGGAGGWWPVGLQAVPFLGINIAPSNGNFESMIFLFQRWDVDPFPLDLSPDGHLSFSKCSRGWSMNSRWIQLVVSNCQMFFFHPYLGGNDPIWRIFSKWVGSTTN